MHPSCGWKPGGALLFGCALTFLRSFESLERKTVLVSNSQVRTLQKEFFFTKKDSIEYLNDALDTGLVITKGYK